MLVRFLRHWLASRRTQTCAVEQQVSVDSIQLSWNHPRVLMFCTPCVIEMHTYGISPSWDYGVVWQSMLSWTAIDIAESSCMPTRNPVACRRWIQLHADAESSCMPTLNPVACRRWIQLHADAESSCMPTYGQGSQKLYNWPKILSPPHYRNGVHHTVEIICLYCGELRDVSENI